MFVITAVDNSNKLNKKWIKAQLIISAIGCNQRD